MYCIVPGFFTLTVSSSLTAGELMEVEERHVLCLLFFPVMYSVPFSCDCRDPLTRCCISRGDPKEVGQVLFPIYGLDFLIYGAFNSQYKICLESVAIALTLKCL